MTEEPASSSRNLPYWKDGQKERRNQTWIDGEKVAVAVELGEEVGVAEVGEERLNLQLVERFGLAVQEDHKAGIRPHELKERKAEMAPGANS